MKSVQMYSKYGGEFVGTKYSSKYSKKIAKGYAALLYSPTVPSSGMFKFGSKAVAKHVTTLHPPELCFSFT
jgi:hypothetical protein